MSVTEPGAVVGGTATNGAPLLRLTGCTCAYGPVVALRDVDLEVRRGEVVCILGVNGAGKTTLLSAIAGLVRPTRGQVAIDGQSSVGARPEQVVRRGVALVPEGRQLFGTLSVKDNLLMGGYPGRKDGAAIRGTLHEVYELFPVLSDFEDRPAASLSGGEQQMLAIGRALMSRPRLLMLDEPSLGLAPMMVQRVMDLVSLLADRDRGVLLVEQLARVALQVAHRGYLLEGGRVVLSGASAELQANDRVREIYMGVRKDRPGIS
jgi:branched-chain amino acid transport system ATP-binding protein